LIDAVENPLSDTGSNDDLADCASSHAPGPPLPRGQD
jgi:hypothetical protein